MLKQIILTLLFLGVALSAKITREDIASVNKALTTAISIENRCTTAVDCATVAVGARACGGPSSYAVYATKSSNVDDIRSLAELTTKFERQYNMENSVISICSLVTPPVPLCDESNKCVAGSRFSPSGPVAV